MQDIPVANLDERITEARPRLLRLAQLNGIAPDEAEDVVQETCIEAWRHLANLREPARLGSWLDGICRNVCKRHHHAQSASFEVSESGGDEQGIDAEAFDRPDPLAIDPLEALERQDMGILLDRALGHLSPGSRELVALCYLAEVPQREAAERLDISVGVLELKLHRARRQLRQVLEGPLHDDAQAFGLLSADETMGWQESRQWCWICGKRPLRGTFELQPSGIMAFRMRCPDCSPQYGVDIISTSQSPLILPTIGTLRSFRPALKRTLRAGADFTDTILKQRRCNLCQSPLQITVVDRAALDAHGSAYVSWPQNLYLQVACAHCGSRYILEFFSVMLTHPHALDFVMDRPRVVTTLTAIDSYDGQTAIRSRLIDRKSGKRLTVMTHPQTFEVMATILDA
jgi:RNA polymerase sigma-70 factor (ECF subfamily)